MTTSREETRYAAILARRTLQHEPRELYETVGRPDLSQVFKDVTNYMAAEVVETHEIPSDMINGPKTFLYNALADTHHILMTRALVHSVDVRTIPAIARHPHTIMAIATLAMRPEEQMHALMHSPVRGDFYDYDQSNSYIEVSSHLAIPSVGGCPYAHRPNSREPCPSRLFRGVIGLSGDLIALCYEEANRTREQ